MVKDEKMKTIRISFENFEENKETHYILCGDFADDKKLLKKKINEIIEEVFGNGKEKKIIKKSK